MSEKGQGVLIFIVFVLALAAVACVFGNLLLGGASSAVTEITAEDAKEMMATITPEAMIPLSDVKEMLRDQQLHDERMADRIVAVAQSADKSQTAVGISAGAVPVAFAVLAIIGVIVFFVWGSSGK